MPIKDRQKRRTYMKNYMGNYRRNQTEQLRKLTSNPEVQRLAKLMGVKLPMMNTQSRKRRKK